MDLRSRRKDHSHVHQVRLVWRLVFDLWVNNGRVGDPCGMWSRRSWNHVMWEPESSTEPQRRENVCVTKKQNMTQQK